MVEEEEDETGDAWIGGAVGSRCISVLGIACGVPGLGAGCATERLLNLQRPPPIIPMSSLPRRHHLAMVTYEDFIRYIMAQCLSYDLSHRRL
jgi:hypothetical protein